MSIVSRILFLSFFSLFLVSCSSLEETSSNSSSYAVSGVSGQTKKVAKWFEANRHRPPKLRAFLKRMPKGGDIHTHLSGAVYAESYLRWSGMEKRCVNPETGVISEDNYEPCKVKPEVSVSSVLEDSELYGDIINKLSLRNKAYAGQSGHDQFFEAFTKFAGGNKGKMIAELSNRAANQNIAYLEIMLSAGKKYTKPFGKKIKFDGDFDSAYAQHLREISRFINNQQELAEHENSATKLLACGTDTAQLGCDVDRRYMLQIKRISSPSSVFSQLVYAFELVKHDPLAVGINLVAPEDNRVALKDYNLHMKMIQYLSKKYPNVSVSLHAGELVLGLVPPKHLHDHIRQAVEIAGAKRIGHGVDVLYETKPFQLMNSMKQKDVLVEICLSSNEAILGVAGKHHPLPEYLEYGVPITLATDDEGISRIDLSHEYQRAAETYGVSYPVLKTMARNSIYYSFLDGENLWINNTYHKMHRACQGVSTDNMNDACRNFLNQNDKAKTQWKLEKQFNEFEHSEWF